MTDPNIASIIYNKLNLDSNAESEFGLESDLENVKINDESYPSTGRNWSEGVNNNLGSGLSDTEYNKTIQDIERGIFGGGNNNEILNSQEFNQIVNKIEGDLTKDKDSCWSGNSIFKDS